VRSATKHILHEGMLWGAAALAVFAIVYFFDDLRAALAPHTDRIASATKSMTRERGNASGFSDEVRLRGNGNGHFVFDAAVNDRTVTVVADTGATLVVLTYEDAKRVGLSPFSLDFSARVQTANGIAHVAPVTLDRVRVKDITLRNVPAVVAEKGALSTNLLGMSFLGRLESFQVQNGELVLVQ